jgi:hypothetical protein
MPKGEILNYLGWFSFMSTLEASPVENSSIPSSMVKGPKFFLGRKECKSVNMQVILLYMDSTCVIFGDMLNVTYLLTVREL